VGSQEPDPLVSYAAERYAERSELVHVAAIDTRRSRKSDSSHTSSRHAAVARRQPVPLVRSRIMPRNLLMAEVGPA